MTNQGRLRLGYFPLPLAEARRISACLRYPDSPFSALDLPMANYQFCLRARVFDLLIPLPECAISLFYSFI